jgi:NADP-dependent 3-hydroxy acid dehydrogenase YdfG
MFLQHKIVIITGASRGIGHNLALELAKHHCKLILFARSKAELENLKESCVNLGSSCDIFVGDIAHADFIESSIAQTIEKYGKIDFLINNAGLGSFGPVENYSESDFDLMFNTNVKGTFLLTKQVVPSMKKEASGHIITLISDVGKRVFANGAIYCATKYAQEAFTSTLRKEIRPFGIKVSNIYSGLVDSDFHETEQGSIEQEDWLKTQDMVRSILFIMNQDKHVVIDELMIHPISQDY